MNPYLQKQSGQTPASDAPVKLAYRYGSAHVSAPLDKRGRQNWNLPMDLARLRRLGVATQLIGILERGDFQTIALLYCWGNQEARTTL